MKLTSAAQKLLTILSRGGNVINIHGSLSDEYAESEQVSEHYKAEYGIDLIKNESRWFKSIDDVSIPDVWVKYKRNVYFAVNPGYEILTENAEGREVEAEYTRQQIKNVEAVNALYAEFDAKDYGSFDAILAHLDTLALKPNAVVQSSANGAHVYWFLTQPFLIEHDEMQLERAKWIQRSWVHFVGGDTKATDLARMLRIPGTLNYKKKYAPNYPTVAVVNAWTGKNYTFADFEALLPQVEQRTAKTTSAKVESQGDGQNLRQAKYWRVMLDNICSELEAVIEGGRNTFVYEAGLKIGSRFAACNGSKDEALNRVIDAARTCGLSENETRKSFESGFVNGTKDPRSLPACDTYYTESVDSLAEFENWRGILADSATDESETVTIACVEHADDETMKALFLNKQTDNESFAQCVHYRYGGKFLFTATYGWLHYNKTHWEPEGAGAAIERAITETIEARKSCAEKTLIGGAITEKLLESIAKKCTRDYRLVSNIKSQLESLVTVKNSRFDNDPDLLNCKNGVVNLRNGTITPHSPKQNFLYVCPAAYKPDLDFSEWESWLTQAVTPDGQAADIEMVNFLRQAIGYTLTGHTREEIWFYLFGPSRSGKGTFTEVLSRMLGTTLARSAPFSTFTADTDVDAQNFALAPFRQCRFVSASESNNSERLNGAKVKQLTGGDPVRCAFKHRDSFEYVPGYKIWASSNYPVNADPDDPAVWGRTRIVTFPNSHLGAEDKSLKARMVQTPYLERVLCWAVSGAMEWYQTGPRGMTEPQASVKAKHGHREAQDIVGQWLEECCTIVVKGFATNEAIADSYTKWCSAHNTESKKLRGLTQSLEKKGFGRDLRKIAGKTQRGFTGFVIQTEQPSNRYDEVEGI